MCRQVLKCTRKHVKTVPFHHFGVIFDLGVPPNFSIQISVPRAQKGWEPPVRKKEKNCLENFYWVVRLQKNEIQSNHRFRNQSARARGADDVIRAATSCFCDISYFFLNFFTILIFFHHGHFFNIIFFLALKRFVWILRIRRTVSESPSFFRYSHNMLSKTDSKNG